MIALIQRVTQAQVHIADQLHASIAKGLLVFLCAQRGDTQDNADRLLKKLLNYRVFSDAQGKMNLSVTDVQGELLIVSQFTLAADTRSGTRPSFTPAADPATGQMLYDYFVDKAKHSTLKVATGVFAADMKVGLVNDGPVTFWLHTPVPPAQVLRAVE